MNFDGMTVAQLREYIDAPDMREYRQNHKVTSKTPKPELIRIAGEMWHDQYADELHETTPEAQHRPMDVKTVSTPYMSQRKIIRMIRASQSRRLFQNGRAMGAKHYAMLREAELAQYGVIDDMGTNPDALKPLSYHDRVRHYAVQNGQGLLSADEFPGAALTPRQWRRAQHKQNKNRAFGTKEARYL